MSPPCVCGAVCTGDTFTNFSSLGSPNSPASYNRRHHPTLQAGPPIQGHTVTLMTPSKVFLFSILLVIKDTLRSVIKIGSQLWDLYVKIWLYDWCNEANILERHPSQGLSCWSLSWSPSAFWLGAPQLVLRLPCRAQQPWPADIWSIARGRGVWTLEAFMVSLIPQCFQVYFCKLIIHWTAMLTLETLI